MARPIKEVVDACALHDPARIHREHAVGELGGHRQVVRDEDRREVKLSPELAEKVDDRALREDVEGGRRLVEDDDARIEEQRHRDEDALAHPARELVRVGAQYAIGIEVHEVEELARAVVHAMAVVHAVRAAGVEEVLPDRDHGIERGQRGLEHHRALGPAEPTELLAVELEDRNALPPAVIHDLAAGDPSAARREANEADGEGRFAGARLADDRERLALFEVERDVAHRMDGTAARPVLDREPADRQDGHTAQERRRGLKTSSSPDASHTRESWKSAIAMIGPIR